MVSPDVIRSFYLMSTARHIKAYPEGMVMMMDMQVYFHVKGQI